MPNLAVTFRQEITRLARREVRNQTQTLRKASAQYRKDIAALKRHASELKFEVARLERRVGKDVAPSIAEEDPAKVRFSAKSVVAQRRNLGISAADFGKLIGVTAHTIYKWEHGNSRPRKAQLSAFASIRRSSKAEALARLEQMRDKAPKRRTLKR
ncbi:MAG: helix-turn-helix domain-containing protein [Pseudomonadota bacterium]